MVEEELVEALASIEHDQWGTWTQALAIHLALGPDTALLLRWQALWVPYEQLTDEQKEKDRIWARQVIDLLQRRGIEL
jgi:hypothetical protein